MHVIKVLLSILLSVHLGAAKTSCFGRFNCHDENLNKTFIDGDAWNSINKQDNMCSECICVESKEYTVSCIDVYIKNKITKTPGVKKSSLAGKQMTPYQILKTLEARRIEDVEVELSEEEALKMRCKKREAPVYNPNTQDATVTHTHHYFMKAIMYCCEKSHYRGKIDPQCTLTFDVLCMPRVVQEGSEELCAKSVEILP